MNEAKAKRDKTKQKMKQLRKDLHTEKFQKQQSLDENEQLLGEIEKWEQYDEE